MKTTLALAALFLTMAPVWAKPNIPDLAHQCDSLARQKACRELAGLAEHDKDISERIQAISFLRDQAVLARIATGDSDAQIRMAAVGNLTDQAVLAKIAVNDKDESIRFAATGKLTNPNQAMLARIKFEFTKIMPGEFMMGCSAGDTECDSSEKPAHRVQITKSFEMEKYDVTQAQWEFVMGSNPSYFEGEDRPVENVSWNDVQEFLQKLNARHDGYRYRLPTEAEWEYAARAGTAEKYYGASLDAIAWYAGNSGNETHPVGMKQPNSWGLYDMEGNVWQWVQDWYDADYYPSSPAADPQGPPNGQYRVARGGSWFYDSRYARVSFRYDLEPSNQYNFVGVRCVREPQKE